MKKEAKYQSPASVAMAAAVLEVIGKGENQSMETLKKDVADAFSLINRAFAAYQESLKKDQETKDETPTDSQNNESEKPGGNGQALKIDKEKLDACTEDVHRAFPRLQPIRRNPRKARRNKPHVQAPGKGSKTHCPRLYERHRRS